MYCTAGDSYPELKDWVAEGVTSKSHQGIYICTVYMYVGMHIK